MIYLDKTCLGGNFHKIFERKGLQFEVVDGSDCFENSKKNIYITSQKNRFVHQCPATREYRCCNYMVVDAVEGCPFDCSYCILQVYLNHDFIKVYDDLEGIRESILSVDKSGKCRIGTGELSDSLAIDNILCMTDFLIPIVNQCENIQFEFKTKSTNITNLFRHNPKNVVVSFSLNPQEIVDSEEHFASPVFARIKAAKDLSDYGYKVSFHFDPLIDWDNFEELYADLLDHLFENVDEKKVEFISISTFRFIPELADIIRIKFPETKLLSSRFIKGLDGKMRYFKSKRIEMLRFILNRLNKNWPTVFTYFCMEDKSIWRKLKGFDPGLREEFEKNFKWYRHESIIH
ncbi:SPL family radical SAM protein [Calditerrivibrio sp.]|jgi:spore photoproduct lyase|uniref:SPL family radical SAM protein n=1 Tax=Calditerrivibrio sp. TaxID=2792612 RepID=UPI003D109D1E